MSPAAAPPFPGAAAALGLTLGAGVLRALVLVLLSPSFGPRYAFLGMASIAAFGAMLAVAAPRLAGSPATRLGFVPASRWAWGAVPFLVASLLLVSELENWTRGLVPLHAEQAPGAGKPLDPAAWLEIGLVLVLVVPACEEIFFRGLVQPGLVAQIGRAQAVVVTALLHGLVWAVPYVPMRPGEALASFVLYAGMGLVLGVLREAAHSIRPPLALAMLYGAASLAASTGALGIPGFDDQSAAHTPLEWLAPAALLLGVGLGLCRVASRG